MVHRGDYWLADLLAKHLADFEERNAVDCHLVWNPSLKESEVATLAEKLSVSFRAVHTHRATRIRKIGWPMEATDMFLSACDHLRACKAVGPFYLMEPDCVPLVRGWLGKLDAEYARAGVNVLGACGASMTDPAAMFHPGDHIGGTAIYPDGFPWRFTFRLIDGLMEPWDMALRSDLPRIGAAHSPLFAERWRTERYFRDANGRVGCYRRGSTERASDIDPCSVVVHGCKDSSIHRLFSRPAMALHRV